MQDDNNKRVGEEDTADYIQKFFINVGNAKNDGTKQNPRCNFSAGNSDPVISRNNLDNGSLQRVDNREVLRLVKNININKSSGIKDISSTVLKEAVITLITPLTYLYNQSLQKNTFPTSWKKATVVPIPKGGDKTRVKNLRPISLLPQPGKIMEKLVHTQLSEFLESKKLLFADAIWV